MRSLVMLRARSVCESCGAAEAQSVHHRRPRGMGGSRSGAVHSPVNLLAVCGRGSRPGCHGLIHQHPDDARRAGLLVRQGADPARIAVRLHDGRSVLLGADGSYIPIPAEG